VLVSSPAVLSFHGAAIRRALSFRPTTEIVTADGEGAKTLSSLAQILDSALESGVRRDDFVVAFGGGVVTDLAGFAAAILLRGVAWWAIPTTLLGMADAAIGGKTGIDHAKGKNLVGSFHLPRGVLIDPALLETLPQREFRSGLVEVYKALLVGDEEGAGAMAGRLEEIADSRAVADFLGRAVAVKQRIVERDFRESGERRLLNFGHTLGHAIEHVRPVESVTHGEAVAVGMAAALELSVRKCGFGEEEAGRMVGELLSFAGDGLTSALDPDSSFLWSALSRDKKFSSQGSPAVLLEKPGTPRIEPASAEEWRDALIRVLRRSAL
jgi:3-dehydroquinate synthase